MTLRLFCLLILCTPFAPLMAAYDAETKQTGYEVWLEKYFGEQQDDGIKVWMTYPDGTAVKRIRGFDHENYVSNDRFFIPDYRIKDGYDDAPYQSLQLRVHMQGWGKKSTGFLGVMLDTVKRFTPARYRSYPIEIKPDRTGKRGLPFIEYVTTPKTGHPMFESLSVGYLRRGPDSSSAYGRDDIIRIFLNPFSTVMADSNPAFYQNDK